ncbi:hypothetical protein [Silvimonas sp.]|uniref:hypothetical protein n=1 Tax=Silvimonas sp. TaxID=2650811 RepID=UPI00284E5657|nr:hypothetical protein [Silvimonas sp.]MDR3430254.1 hypothetical protein [Silvimonas sp.]
MKIAFQQSLIEQLHEAGSRSLSPAKVCEFFGFSNQDLADRARVDRHTVTAYPQAPQLQKYLKDLVSALAVATEATGDAKRAAFLLRNEPLRVFGYKTADTLIQEGRTNAVIAYIESSRAGAAG